jgi:glycosyltransferase involved in cell wall biosynthesis
MNLKGLVISQQTAEDTSAYSNRIHHVSECLAERSIDCDTLYMKEHPLLYKQTTASLFMPLWLGTLREYDFIITHCEGAGQTLFFCRPFVKGPIIHDIHGDPRAHSALERQVQSHGRITTPSLRVRMVAWMTIECSDYIVAQCAPHAEALVREGVPRDSVGIIPNGVDLDMFRQLPFPEHPEFTLAYVGGFQTWQNMDNLVEAFDRVQSPNIKLLMVGFTENDTAVKREFAQKFGDRVKLVDRTDRASLTNLSKSVGCFIIPRIEHPTIRHALPTKFIEYAAMGRPIMVNDVDVTADFVRKYDCGFVSDPSPESMAKTVEDIAKVPVERLSEMGNRARRMAEENFSWKRIGDDYAEMIRSQVARFGREHK